MNRAVCNKGKFKCLEQATHMEKGRRLLTQQEWGIKSAFNDFKKISIHHDNIPQNMHEL